MPWSDNNGPSDTLRNRCHQSSNAPIRKVIIPGETPTIGALADSRATDMDFHFLACSGAETENLLPYHTVTGTPPVNGAGENGRIGQNGMVSQLDAGLLDENTTLVTLSIGGNDLRFSGIISGCAGSVFLNVPAAYCDNVRLDGDTEGVRSATTARLATELPTSLTAVLTAIRDRAPNATVLLIGYPTLFETGSACVTISPVNQGWLNNVASEIQDVMEDAANAADSPSARVIAVDPQTTFAGKSLCTGGSISGITGLEFLLTPGEPSTFTIGDWRIVAPEGLASQTSIHPNDLGTGYYAQAIQSALGRVS